MKMIPIGLWAVSLLLVSLIGCVPTKVASPGYTGLIGNEKSTPGERISAPNNHIVSIGAGKVEIGTTSYWRAWYLIDRGTHTCWMKVGESLGAMDCCALMGIKGAITHLTWLTGGACDEQSAQPQ
jgi:hypothetical protein